MRSAGLFISPRNTPCTDCDARCRGSHYGTLRTLKDRACRAGTRCYSHISWCRVDRTARSTPFRTEADTRSVPVKRQPVRTARAVARNEWVAWRYMPATTSNTPIPGQVGMLSSRGSFRLPLRLVFCTRGGDGGGLYAPGSLIPLALRPTLQVHRRRQRARDRKQRCLCTANRNIESGVSAIRLVLALSNVSYALSNVC
jgi:hypothetical protein